jgi:hypothetical protein
MSATASRSLELRRFISERLYDRSLEQGAGSRKPLSPKGISDQQWLAGTETEKEPGRYNLTESATDHLFGVVLRSPDASMRNAGRLFGKRIDHGVSCLAAQVPCFSAPTPSVTRAQHRI